MLPSSSGTQVGAVAVHACHDWQAGRLSGACCACQNCPSWSRSPRQVVNTVSLSQKLAVHQQLDTYITSPLSIVGVMLVPAGLPLLQPGTRRYVKRAFAAAAKALQAVSSPLAQLRAQLHLECGKCEAADDSLLKVGLVCSCWLRHSTPLGAGRADCSPRVLVWHVTSM